MHWLVVTALVIIEISLVALIVKSISLLPRVWLRWLVGLAALLLYSFLVLGVLLSAYEFFLRYTNDWTVLFSQTMILPTARLYLAVTVAALSLSLLLMLPIGLWCDPLDLSRPRANRWRFRIILASLGVGLLLLLILAAVQDRLVSRQLASVETLARQTGVTVAPQNCDAADNAAREFEASMRNGRPLEECLGEDYFQNFEALRGPKWTEYVKQNAETALEIRRAARLSCCRFAIDWSIPNVKLDRPELSHVNRCAKLIAAQGHLAILDGNLDQALADAATLRRIAEHVSKDPNSVAQLVAYSVDGQATSLIEHAIYYRSPTSEELAALLRPDFVFRKRLPQVMQWTKAETYYGMADIYFGRTRSIPLRTPLGEIAANAASLATCRVLFAADDLAATPALFSMIENHTRISYESGAGLDDPQQSKLPATYIGWIEGGGMVTVPIVPLQQVVLDACCRADATRRITDTGLILAAAKFQNEMEINRIGNFLPENDRPIDPFSALPVKIIASDGGIVVYSLGFNRSDEDGQEDEVTIMRGDLAFCLGEAFRNRRLMKSE